MSSSAEAVETKEKKPTEAGNYFISNYPPFSFWPGFCKGNHKYYCSLCYQLQRWLILSNVFRWKIFFSWSRERRESFLSSPSPLYRYPTSPRHSDLSTILEPRSLMRRLSLGFQPSCLAASIGLYKSERKGLFLLPLRPILQ